MLSVSEEEIQNILTALDKNRDLIKEMKLDKDFPTYYKSLYK
jgi:hypothetical protein